MATATLKYLGDLKCELTHGNSGVKFVTSAPPDNNGDGSSFSPTDLLASAYISCLVTIIGIYCEQNKLEFKSCNGSVKKTMESGPRRVAELEIDLDLSGNEWNTDQRAAIIRAAEACPVAKSVSEAMMIKTNYQF